MHNERFWQVQAHWMVGDESRSYTPLTFNSLGDAEHAADEMRDTLSHFVGLEVSLQEVAATDADTSPHPPEHSPTIHASVTKPLKALCGVGVDLANSVLQVDFFDRTSTRRCAECDRLLAL